MKIIAPITPGKAIHLSKIPTLNQQDLSGNEAQDFRELDALAKKLDKMQELLWANQGRSLLLVLQGMDTSGKDGTMRGVFSRTSPLGVRVASFKAPTAQELAHDFLWRVHPHAPAKGEIVIFNRSHYEDLLVPLANDWMDKKSYQQRVESICAWENSLAAHGTRIVKIMLHISKDEQKRRLQARIDNPAKHWKFSLGDLEVRRQWSQYQRAYEQMMPQTATSLAPWYIVPADDKLQRNFSVAKIVLNELAQLKLKAPPECLKYRGIIVE